MKKYAFPIAFTAIIAFLGLIIGYNAGLVKAKELNKDYYNKVEALLDSINEWDESFMDSVVETDTYYEYELSRAEIE